MRASLCVIVPTLNAGRTLEASLGAIATEGHRFEALQLIVTDGGSTDDTLAIALAHGASIVSGQRGRGAQLQAGCAAAEAPWLLVVHADTELATGWSEAVARHMVASAGCAGWFEFRLDDDSIVARIWEVGVALRCAVMALPYGDQALLIPRTLYDAAGGFRAMALMEDVDLVRRLGRQRLRAVAAAARTDAGRFRRRGYLAQSARNWSILARYLMGARPAQLERLYE